MELDDFKNVMHRSPEGPGGVQGAGNDPVQDFLEEMKVKDATERKALLYLVIMFAVFAVIYTSQMAMKAGAMKTGFAILSAGFVMTLAYFLVKYRKAKKISYATPTLEFLRAAERRYAYWTWEATLISVPMLILFGIGGFLIVHSSFEKYFPGSWVPSAIYFAVYLAAISVGTWAGRKQWDKNKRPMYEKIRRMRQEFGE